MERETTVRTGRKSSVRMKRETAVKMGRSSVRKGIETGVKIVRMEKNGDVDSC